METVQPANIVARAKAILLTPDAEWRVIDAEPATVGSLYRNYIIILAAIPPLAMFLRGVLFGYGAFGFTYHPSFMQALSGAIVRYVLSLAIAFLMAVIIDALAPSFGGVKSQVQALKLVAYASTASWLAGIFHLIPGIGFLSILGIYSLYLFYRGLPVMMKSPPEKSAIYTAVVIVVAVVAAIVIAPITAALTGRGGAHMGDGGYSSGSITTPNGGEYKLDKLHQIARAMEESANKAGTAESGPAVPSDRLKALLPDQLSGGLARGEVTSAGGQVAGFGGASASAKYAGNGEDIALTIADLGPIGALAGLGGALGISGDKETPTSYSKLSTQDGHAVAEEYDRVTHHGSYAIVLGNRFMIQAEGSAVTMDQLRDAVGGVDKSALESMSH